uniref:Uncharacterized protein n=1 Tax=Brassica campestris TaxID=3711 RepID=M4CLL3_BRACM
MQKRAVSPPLQDWCSNVEILVEENVSRLVSLQHSADQSFEDWLLIVKVWVVICFVDVQPFLFTSGGLSTRFIYEIRRHRGVEAKLNQICLAGRVYCSTVLAAPCFSTDIHVDLLPTGNDNTTTASTSLRRSILVSISIMCALQQRFSLCSGLQRRVPPDVESLIYHRSLVSNLRTTGATYLSAKPYIGILNLNSGISGLLVTVTEFLNS